MRATLTPADQRLGESIKQKKRARSSAPDPRVDKPSGAIRKFTYWSDGCGQEGKKLVETRREQVSEVWVSRLRKTRPPSLAAALLSGGGHLCAHVLVLSAVLKFRTTVRLFSEPNSPNSRNKSQPRSGPGRTRQICPVRSRDKYANLRTSQPRSCPSGDLSSF